MYSICLYLGTTKAQMASCYLLTMCDDSIEGIFETLRRCAIISKNAGGIGLAISCIRANGSYIEGVRMSASIFVTTAPGEMNLLLSFECFNLFLISRI